ncbi:amidohydrolase family protein [Pseudoxanthomonas sp. PXM02]|uniref:amidohydrolase family protein n=1 Tax=Pseudoxanthomonas sp. PXM02 TaxID=2769294 RepID=UPI00178674D1|nr:amidohydrolase family protein [Pseudoxanthomonas sp. PXM02]MBD9477573.1 amidohydrolase family protein [Pseudoxanthomonas sp. PXM02]
MRCRTILPGLAIALSSFSALAVDTVVLQNARVFDGREDLGVVDIVVEGGRIAHVGDAGDPKWRDARRIDYTGKHVLPGLVSNHSHVGNTEGLEHGDRFYTRDNVVRDLRQFQRYGVTTVTSLGMNGEAFTAIRDEISNDATLGAQLYGAGAGIGAVAGAPPAQIMGLANDPVARPATPDQARAAVRSQKDSGVDLIKLWVDDLDGRFPMMAPAIYRAAIDEAHRVDLRVAAHIHDHAQAADLVDAGVDIIAHGIRDEAVSPALAKAMKDEGVWYIPTVSIDEANYLYAENPAWLATPFLRNALPAAVAARWSDPDWQSQQLAGANIPGARKAVETNLRNLRTLHEAGVSIGFGTDAGAMPQRVIGFAEHRELELMTMAGFTPAQALAVATSDAARLQGLDDRGLVATGKRADLLVLDADPLQDILNTRRIHAVWQAGRQVSDGPSDDAHAP